MTKITKKDRFLRVAETRTDKIIKMIRLLGNCSNKNNYEYSESQINQIFDAISSELKLTKNKFKTKKDHFILRDK